MWVSSPFSVGRSFSMLQDAQSTSDLLNESPDTEFGSDYSVVCCKETHQGLLGGATQDFPFPLQGKGSWARDHAGSGFALESSNQVSLKMHSKVLILAKAPLCGCLICELKWSRLISSCSRWTEMRETFWLIKHTIIHRVKDQGVISCGQSPSSAECWRQCVRLKGF